MFGIIVASPDTRRVRDEFPSSVLAGAVPPNFGERNSESFQYFSMSLSESQAGVFKMSGIHFHRDPTSLRG